jgi:hypothetical protein
MLKNRNSEPKIESIEIEYKIGKNEKYCHQDQDLFTKKQINVQPNNFFYNVFKLNLMD